MIQNDRKSEIMLKIVDFGWFWPLFGQSDAGLGARRPVGARATPHFGGSPLARTRGRQAGLNAFLKILFQDLLNKD